MSVRVVVSTARRNLVTNVRAYPWSFVLHSLIHAVLVLGLAWVIYHRLFDGRLHGSFERHVGSGDYITFIAVGVATYTLIQSSLLAIGRSLITERREGTIDALFVAPVGRVSYLLGTFLDQLVRSAFDVAVIAAVARLFGARLALSDPVGLALTVAVSLAGVYGMGVILAVAMLYLRETYLVQNTFLTFSYLACGVIVPVEYLPAPIRVVGYVIPMTPALRLIRRGALGEGTLLSQPGDAAWLVILCAAYCAAGLFLLKRLERTVLEKALS